MSVCYGSFLEFPKQCDSSIKDSEKTSEQILRLYDKNNCIGLCILGLAGSSLLQGLSLLEECWGSSPVQVGASSCGGFLQNTGSRGTELLWLQHIGL